MNERTLARREAMRAIVERHGVSLDMLAVATGRSPVSVEREAVRYGWKPAGTGLTLRERLALAMERLADKLEQASRQMLEGEGGVDRAQIDAIMAMMRALEKIAEFAPPEEAANKKQMTRDEELAAILDNLNGRIVQLARELAAQLAEGERRPDGA